MFDRPVISTNQFQALYRAAQAVLRFDTFQDSARAIFDEAKNVTGAVSGYIALLNAGGDENEVLFLDDGGLPCTVDPELPMPIRGLRELAYRDKKVVYDNDFMDSEWAAFMPAGHVRLDNVLFAPLIIEGQARGVMGLANKPSDFDDHDAQLAAALGEFAAIALANSHTLDELRATVTDLKHALDEVRTLRGILPICAGCKRIRDDKGYWHQVEAYISDHSEAAFSHGLCAECLAKLYPEEE